MAVVIGVDPTRARTPPWRSIKQKNCWASSRCARHRARSIGSPPPPRPYKRRSLPATSQGHVLVLLVWKVCRSKTVEFVFL